MLKNVREHNIDLFILIVDVEKNLYKPESFRFHVDNNSFELTFKFEDWSGIIGDGKEHMYIVTEYVNAKGQVLIKYQDEDFESLLTKLETWCEKHRI